MREWRNWQTRTFEGRVICSYGFKSRFSHQVKRDDFMSSFLFCKIQSIGTWTQPLKNVSGTHFRRWPKDFLRHNYVFALIASKNSRAKSRFSHQNKKDTISVSFCFIVELSIGIEPSVKHLFRGTSRSGDRRIFWGIILFLHSLPQKIQEQSPVSHTKNKVAHSLLIHRPCGLLLSQKKAIFNPSMLIKKRLDNPKSKRFSSLYYITQLRRHPLWKSRL